MRDKRPGEFMKGLFVENPVFVIALGLCPTLAVTTSIENGIGMGIAASFVLLMSNILISMLRKVIPERIRIPAFIAIIASFVTITDLVMKGYFPPLSKRLGMFVPLIVVNCIILGRAEAFASKRGLWDSILDGLGMGVGFTMALLLIGAIRELLGSGKLLNRLVIPGFKPASIMILPPGGYLVLGLLLGLFSYMRLRREDREKRGPG